MADIIQLKDGRYKGVSFVFEDASTTGGNRLIKFNYPGSDKQSIERQGKAPRSFSLTIWIPFEDYYAQRDLLLRVLEDGEKGTLTHPTFGDVENVINGGYTLSERISELGRGSITVLFEVDNATGIPVQSAQLASQVQALSDSFNSQAVSDLAGGYSVSLQNSGNFTDAIANIGSVGAAFSSALSLVSSSSEKVAEVNKQINDFTSAAGSLVQAPQELALNISALFESVDNFADTPSGVLTSLRSLFDFGDDDPAVMETTVARVERKKNRDLIRANIRSQALSYAYVNAALLAQGDEFQTEQSLDSAQSELEAEYVDIRENQAISNSGLEAMDRLRVQGQKTLDASRVNAPQIITIETPRMPLSVLVYSYYGNTDLFDTIAELNNVKENAFVEGELRILTA